MWVVEIYTQVLTLGQQALLQTESSSKPLTCPCRKCFLKRWLNEHDFSQAWLKRIYVAIRDEGEYSQGIWRSPEWEWKLEIKFNMASRMCQETVGGGQEERRTKWGKR